MASARLRCRLVSAADGASGALRDVDTVQYRPLVDRFWSCLRRVPEWELCGRDGGQSREVKHVSARQGMEQSRFPTRRTRSTIEITMDTVRLLYRCSNQGLIQAFEHQAERCDRPH